MRTCLLILGNGKGARPFLGTSIPTPTPANRPTLSPTDPGCRACRSRGWPSRRRSRSRRGAGTGGDFPGISGTRAARRPWSSRRPLPQTRARPSAYKPPVSVPFSPSLIGRGPGGRCRLAMEVVPLPRPLPYEERGEPSCRPTLPQISRPQRGAPIPTALQVFVWVNGSHKVSFLRHASFKNASLERRWRMPLQATRHRRTLTASGYSSVGCSPALPASAAPDMQPGTGFGTSSHVLERPMPQKTQPKGRAARLPVVKLLPFTHEFFHRAERRRPPAREKIGCCI